MVNPSIYDQLAKESFSALTITQLNAGTSVTAVDQATIDYWKGPLTLARVLEASRTYAGGTLPIPESGTIETIELAAGASNLFQPTGSEIYRIKSIHTQATGGAGACQISYADGTTTTPFKDQFVVATAGTLVDLNTYADGPVDLSNALYLMLTETGGANAITIKIAYFKVSL
jgi:hypothetical protein